MANHGSDSGQIGCASGNGGAGASGGNAGESRGGGIANLHGGALSVIDSVFGSNTTQGGTGGAAGLGGPMEGQGGGADVRSGQRFELDHQPNQFSVATLVQRIDRDSGQ
jgi:hypothetical protein